MTGILEPLLKSLDRVQYFNQKKLILIRHTNREEIPKGRSGDNVPITPEGKEEAFALGENLKSFSIGWCKTSPLLRCTQTIDSIASGYGTKIIYSNSKLLGEPGPFVFDSDQAINAFIDYGTETVVREMINGNTYPGIWSARKGSEILLNGLIQLLEENKGNGICISHDAILMPFIAHYCNEHFQEQWLPPLGGVILVACENEYTLWWKGNMYKVVL